MLENINKFPPQFVNIDNIEHSIRYYFRFKDILTGNTNVNETTAIRRFQTSFFGGLDWQKLIDNPKTATKHTWGYLFSVRLNTVSTGRSS